MNVICKKSRGHSFIIGEIYQCSKSVLIEKNFKKVKPIPKYIITNDEEFGIQLKEEEFNEYFIEDSPNAVRKVKLLKLNEVQNKGKSI